MDRPPVLHDVSDAPFIRVKRDGAIWLAEGHVTWRAPPATVDENCGWEWRDGRLRITTSHLGFAPLYYHQREDEIALSPSLVRLLGLGAPLDIDEDALSVFLRMGFYLADRTPFRAIRRVNPGVDCRWPDSPLSEAFAIPHRRLNAMSRGDAIDAYAELFRAAVRRLLPEGDVVLPLSGGQDSRHILLELIEAGRKPRTVTLHRWPPDLDDDMPIARALAERLGLSHTALPVDRLLIRAEIEKNPLTDFCADEHAWLLPLRRFMTQHRGVAFDGIAGDVMSADLYLTPALLDALQHGRTAEAADMLMGQEWIWQRVLNADFYARVSRERAREMLKREIERHLDAPNPASSFQFWNRSRREISLMGFKLVGDVRMPYLDRGVYDHLASLPGRYFVDKAFHRATIARAFPRHADIPFTGGHQSTRITRWRFRSMTLQAVPYLLSGRSRFLKPRPQRLGFLNPMTKPQDVARILYLTQLERTLSDPAE